MAQVFPLRQLAISPAERRRGGFTLIELLLVMFILVVLASIAAPIYIGRKKESQVNAAKTQISLFASSLNLYEQDNGDFPTTEEGLQALITAPPSAKNWHQYMDKTTLPQDPWGNPYQYRCPGQDNRKYDIWSSGPDGQDGTDDDICSWKQ